MDFLDPKKRKAHNIRLMIGYALMTIALLLASVLLLFVAFGYGINSSTGQVTQNGLLFVDAHPEQASIVIDGRDRGKTDGRFVMEAGEYTVELSREGYRSWKRDFVLEGGNIVRLVYPFLFPQNLESRDLLAYATTPDMVSSSPDRRWILSHTPAAMSALQLTDTSTDQLRTAQLALPAGLFAGRTGTQTFKDVEWSTDNRHLLVKYSFDGGYDYLILDRDKPELSISVSQVFGRAFTNVTLRDKKADQLYLYDESGGVLTAGRTSDKSTEQVLTGVISFWPYKQNELLYTTNTGAAADKSLVRLKDSQTTYTIREVVRANKFMLNMAEFDGDTYVVCGSVSDGKVYIYKNPLDTLKSDSKKQLLHTLLMRLDNPEFLSFSANTRFISVQSGAKFAIYDLETKNQYKYDSGLQLAAKQEARWMDGHRLMLLADGKVQVFDYDGINKQTLVDATSGFVPMFDRDYNQLFTVSPLLADKAKVGLLRTDLNLGTE
jgi:hypothetical protein